MATRFPTSGEAEIGVAYLNRGMQGMGMLGQKVLEGAKPGEKNFQVGVCSALASQQADLKEGYYSILVCGMLM